MCVDSESSVKAIESGKSQHPVLNKIYDLAAKFARVGKANNTMHSTSPKRYREMKRQVRLPKKQ